MTLLASIAEWIPDAKTMYTDLSYTPSASDDALFYSTSSWKGMAFRDFCLGRSEGGESFFSTTYWSSLSARHWEVPLTLVGLYLLMIPTLQWYVARYGKFDVRNFSFYWNAMLSIFSWFGVFACVPTIIWSLANHGLYFTTCAPPGWYGTSVCGFFVTLFIYSKIPELVDTVLLILAGKPVVVLQWWHHSTVLLYCWHSYAVRIATGAWFAGMNYTVHSLMYGYFALMGTQYRKAVAPFAIFITLLQLLQMVVGMFVTIKAVLSQTEGLECHVNRTNSVLGLTMYVSYFVLFAKLFVENYLLKRKQQKDTEGSKKCEEKPAEAERKNETKEELPSPREEAETASTASGSSSPTSASDEAATSMERRQRRLLESPARSSQLVKRRTERS